MMSAKLCRDGKMMEETEAVKDYQLCSGMTVAELLRQMKGSWGFTAAKIARGVDIFKKMIDDIIASGTPRIWGTASGGYNVGYDVSAEPIRNWQEEWHDEKSLGADKFARRLWVKRYWADYGCPVACLKLAVIKTGPFKGSITDNPDYELIAYCGTNLGIFDPEGILYVSSVVDDVGLSGINGANVMGFAAELYQRGILTKEDLGGIELKWGDAEAFGKLAWLMAKREKIGDVLAEGTYRAALKISEMKGVDVLKYACLLYTSPSPRD
mgnify:CR=1 FL=1